MRLYQAAFLLVLASIFAVAAWQFSENPGLLKLAILCVLISVVLAITGVMFAVDWLAERSDEHLMMQAQARAVTPASELAERVGGLTSDQLLFLLRQSVEITMLTSPDQPPVYSIVTGRENVPADFAAEYLKLSTPAGELYPIRNFSEGSHERIWASSLIDLLLSHQFAEPAVGNRPAKLLPHVTLQQVAYHLGVEI